MKAKRTVATKEVHPEYSASAAFAARQAGLPYDVPKFLYHEVGDIVDSPDAWRLCVGKNAVAVPADDECAQEVLKRMNSPKRKEFLTELQRLSQPNLLKQLSKGEQARVEHLTEVYSEELTAPVSE